MEALDLAAHVLLAQSLEYIHEDADSPGGGLIGRGIGSNPDVSALDGPEAQIEWKCAQIVINTPTLLTALAAERADEVTGRLLDMIEFHPSVPEYERVRVEAVASREAAGRAAAVTFAVERIFESWLHRVGVLEFIPGTETVGAPFFTTTFAPMVMGPFGYWRDVFDRYKL